MLIRRLDNNHYIVKLASPAQQRLPEKGFQLHAVNALWKFSPRLLPLATAVPGEQGLFVLQASDLAALKTKLRGWGSQLRMLEEHVPSGSLLIECSFALLMHDLLPLPEIRFADQRQRLPTEESKLMEASLSVNGINVLHHQSPGLRGQGMLISIKEQKYNPQDMDLRGRHIPHERESASLSGHATDMATIIAGAANSDPKSQGVAPQASITSSDFLHLLPDPESYFRSMGIVVQNHSYGTQVEGFYGAEAAAYDAAAVAAPEVLHVFSAGNSGWLVSQEGSYKGMEGRANLTGNFKQAKNILLVGAVDSLKRPDAFVSRGPAHDGRIKPELVAFSGTGSSASAALVSGAASLLQQAYQQQKGGEQLPAALLKALLLNTAGDVGPAGIDHVSGYGNLQAQHALEALLAETYLQGTVDHGQELRFRLQVPEGVHALRITLLWPDAPAPANSNKALINDLDLSLEKEGERWLPWVLSSYPHPDSLAKAARRGVDRLNPQEQISLQFPAAGSYELVVRGYDVPLGPQHFYLAWGWQAREEFSWVFPTASDNLPQHGDKSGLLRWESSLSADRGRLEWRRDGESSWQLVEEGIDLGNNYYQWQVPQGGGIGQLRMMAGGAVYESDRFTLSRSMQPKVGFNCTDSLMLYWPAVPGAEGYTVYGLGDSFLEPVASLSDTLLILQKQQHPYQHLAVAPRMAHGMEGIRSRTFDYSLQGVECYLSNFIADLQQEGVELRLDLGTTRLLDQIIFERNSGAGFVPLYTVEPSAGGAFSHVLFDDTLPEGFSTYRARLLFASGEQLSTQIEEVFFLRDSPALVFPNPVRRQGELNVYLKEADWEQPALFMLFNSTGQPVLQQKMENERNVLQLPALVPGIYLYTLTGKGLHRRGRLVVQ